MEHKENAVYIQIYGSVTIGRIIQVKIKIKLKFIIKIRQTIKLRQIIKIIGFHVIITWLEDSLWMVNEIINLRYCSEIE